MRKTRLPGFTAYTEEKELRFGYLHKSPPSHLRSMKSWTRRYFVLSKTSEDTWTLKYFKNEKKERVLGKIVLSDISMLMFCPESHSTFGRIHDHFRCPAACVLLLRTKGRDYFLVGENSWEMDGWFNDLYSLLRSRPDMVSHESAPRAISAPPAPLPMRNTRDPEQAEKNWSRSGWSMTQPPTMTLKKGIGVPVATLRNKDSGPAVIDTPAKEEPHYAVPRTMKALERKISEDNEKDEGTEDFIYEDMATLLEVALKADDKVDDQVAYDSEDSDDSDFCDDPKAQDSASLNMTATDERRNRTVPPPKLNHDRRDPFIELGPSPECAITEEPRACVQTCPVAIEMEVCVSKEELRRHLNQQCVKGENLLMKGDEILALNHMRIDSMQDVEYCLSKLRKKEVMVSIRRKSSKMKMKLD